MTDQWTDRLSEYVDGELDTATTAAIEAHLRGCAACAGTVSELRSVMTRARGLVDRQPDRDLWPGIARRLGQPSGVTSLSLWKRMRRRRVSVSVPQLAAAGVALLLVSTGALWLGLTSGGTPSVAPLPAPGLVVATPVAGVLSEFQPVVSELEQVLATRRDRLDTTTVRVIEESLETIDRAIADAVAALEQDPANPYLSGHLTSTMRRKIEVLEHAVSLAATAS